MFQSGKNSVILRIWISQQILVKIAKRKKHIKFVFISKRASVEFMNGLVDTSPFVNSTAALWLFQYMKKKTSIKQWKLRKQQLEDWLWLKKLTIPTLNHLIQTISKPSVEYLQHIEKEINFVYREARSRR